MDGTMALKTGFTDYSASDHVANTGYSRLKCRPRVRLWIAFAMTVGILSTPLVATAEETRNPLELVVATERPDPRLARRGRRQVPCHSLCRATH
jgi:hypothetical protein